MLLLTSLIYQTLFQKQRERRDKVLQRMIDDLTAETPILTVWHRCIFITLVSVNVDLVLTKIGAKDLKIFFRASEVVIEWSRRKETKGVDFLLPSGWENDRDVFEG